jgi:hypothetical protein
VILLSPDVVEVEKVHFPENFLENLLYLVILLNLDVEVVEDVLN